MKTALLSLAAAAVLSGSVQANPILVVTEPVRSERVQTADLNLKSAAGRVTLEGRIRAAASNVCEVNGDRSIETALRIKACTMLAVADALEQSSGLVASGAGSSVLAARGR